MYGCVSCIVKKAEHPIIDAFELWCWRRLLRVPWTARRSNQSILKEISPGCSLEGMMLKLKLQYFGHLMRTVDLLEKTPVLRGIGGRRKDPDSGQVRRNGNVDLLLLWKTQSHIPAWVEWALDAWLIFILCIAAANAKNVMVLAPSSSQLSFPSSLGPLFQRQESKKAVLGLGALLARPESPDRKSVV